MDSLSKVKKVEQIVVVNLSGHYLKNLGSLLNCSALKICHLAKNYITKFQALINCPNLIKLDLHGNHITNLPNEYFWSEMKYLQVLYLHDNIIGDMRNVRSMFSCPELIVLTLFDTPVSLVSQYRHHIVNGIWSLKALDNFVIADEEIIEDCRNRNKFKALSSSFHLHAAAPPQVTTWQSEMKHIKDLVSNINSILAHHSAVLILQRWSRGFLTRKKLKAAKNSHKRQAFSKEMNAELCSRGIHILEDGSMWVSGNSSEQEDQCNAVHLEIDKKKLNFQLLEDRYEAHEITSGLYPRITKWRMEDTPNFKPNKSDVFQPRTFRQPVFHPHSDRPRLL
ncbi:leucine-rich repeat and IQ domain-containing protein 3 [Scyliorhinus torazame]|uniref:leucine-rich repeat and IQ domain-containing protein 3 n=1 Tax=Scyliorhinus torazame TaxID=75743 RepID=UPI003B5C2D6B